jgi:NAD(P) transhydrogenase subunit beta
MSENFAAFAYLVSGVLFIMALRGLSHPTTSRQGNMYGMIGMAIAIVTTLLLAQPSFNGFVMIIAGLAIGGGAGAYIARKIAMTSMPQLVAGFHSLVGLAAVLVAAAALYSPHAFGIGEVGEIHAQALIEMSLGVAIGAITFTGSIIAFLKLDGRMSGKPIMLPMRHVINAALGNRHRGADRRSGFHRKLHGVLADRGVVADPRCADHRPDRRRRHAGGGVDAELLFGLGCSRHRLYLG